MKSSIRAALAVGALALASSQAFASTVNVTSGMTPVEVGTTNLTPGFNPAYYELNVGSGTSGFLGTYVTLVDSSPELQSITYNIWNDTNGTVGLFSAGATLIDTWTVVDILGAATSTHLFSLAENTQYVLEMIASGTTPASHTTSQISAVPLPAAAWLFGSALLGFGALRRKQKAGNSEMAVA